MKCSACKNKNADSYKRIVFGHELFEALQKMSPNRPYTANSYFCEGCLLLAAEDYKQKQLLLLSNQNADTVNITASSSQTSNERNTRNTVLPHERSSNKENNPKPKRTKLADYKPASSKTKSVTSSSSSQGSVQERPSPASRKRKIAASRVTTDKTSSQESVQEGDILLNVASTSATLSISSQGCVQERPCPASRKRKIATSRVSTDKPSSQESVQEGDILLNVAGSTQNSQENVSTTSSTRSRSQNVSVQSPNASVQSPNASVQSPNASVQSPNASVQNSNIVTAQNQKNAQRNLHIEIMDRETSDRESHSSSDDQQSPIAGPSAPSVKNPRIRQETSRMPDAIRNFFQQGGQGPALNVNNYSRSLAG